MTQFDKAPSEMKPEILAATLDHVPFDGWSEAALRHAADDLGVKTEFIRIAYPDGVPELVEAYLARVDDEMLKLLAKAGLDKMGVTKRITTAIEVRLKLNDERREVVRRTVGYLTMPGNAALSAKCLWRTCDAIWNAAGDTATDYNHYTKRLILGAVYSSTLLVWLGDDSEGFKDTHAFLQHRIGDVMEFEKAKAKVRDLTKDLPDPATILGKMRYPDGHNA